MKAFTLKLLVVGALAAVAAIALRSARPMLGERMQRMIEEAPEDFPPKWMYLNITAIRDNTERILEALEQAPPESGSEAA